MVNLSGKSTSFPLSSSSSSLNTRQGNIIASKYIQLLQSKGWNSFSPQILSILRSKGVKIDSFTYSSLMSALINAFQYQEALNLYASFANDASVVKDRVCRIGYARALGGVSLSLEDWKSRVELFLRESLQDIGPSGTLSVAETFLTNLKFNSSLSYESAALQIDFILNWLTENNISPSEITLVSSNLSLFILLLYRFIWFFLPSFLSFFPSFFLFSTCFN